MWAVGSFGFCMFLRGRLVESGGGGVARMGRGAKIEDGGWKIEQGGAEGGGWRSVARCCITRLHGVGGERAAAARVAGVLQSVAKVA